MLSKSEYKELVKLPLVTDAAELVDRLVTHTGGKSEAAGGGKFRVSPPCHAGKSGKSFFVMQQSNGIRMSCHKRCPLTHDFMCELELAMKVRIQRVFGDGSIRWDDAKWEAKKAARKYTSARHPRVRTPRIAPARYAPKQRTAFVPDREVALKNDTTSISDTQGYIEIRDADIAVLESYDLQSDIPDYEPDMGMTGQRESSYYLPDAEPIVCVQCGAHEGLMNWGYGVWACSTTCGGNPNLEVTYDYETGFVQSPEAHAI